VSLSDRLVVAVAVIGIVVGLALRIHCLLDPGRAFFDAHRYTAYVKALGIAVLCGGFDRAFEVYRLLLAKAYTLDYAIRTGDGPWFRYPLDLFAINPATTLLAIGSLFTLRRDARAPWFLAGFVLVSMLLMTQVRFGMNLRYGAMWDAPLCALAAIQIQRLATAMRPGLRPSTAALLLGSTLSISASLANSLVLRANIAEPVAQDYLKALRILHDRPKPAATGSPAQTPAPSDP